MELSLYVFVLVILGYVVNKIDFMWADFFKNCAKFTYWVALPVLLFDKISCARFGFLESWKISATMIVSSFFIVLIAWILSSFIKLEHKLKKTFIQTSFHCNTAFVGLPVIIYTVSGGFAFSLFAVTLLLILDFDLSYTVAISMSNLMIQRFLVVAKFRKDVE